jgi:hypothetical protein
MSERRRDADWIRSVAAARGIELDQVRAAEIATEVAPTLERFDELVARLDVDDDPDAFQRRLAVEAQR